METSNPFKNLNDLYDKNGGYLQLFGGSFIMCLLILVSVFLIFGYLNIHLYMNDLRKNFDSIKCHPGVIPFAGQIVNDPTLSPLEFTNQNFQFCLTMILSQVVEMFLTPIYKMQDAVLGVFDIVYTAFTLVRKTFDRIKSVWQDMFTYIMSKLTSIIIPFQKKMIRLKDILAKTGGLMQAFIMSILTVDFAFSSYLGVIFNVCASLLTAGYYAIKTMFSTLIMWPAAELGLIAWDAGDAATKTVYNWAKSTLNLASVDFPKRPSAPKNFQEWLDGTIELITDATGAIVEVVEEVFVEVAEDVVEVVEDAGEWVEGAVEDTGSAISEGANTVGSWFGITPSPPPSCFNPSTFVNMKDGSKKMMKDIKIGEILKGNIEVIATLKIKNKDKDNVYYKIYSKEINDYIYVTGSHLIQEPDTLKFIPVSKSKCSIKTTIVDKQFSCLVTSTNTIPIGEYLFWDWED